MVYSPCRQPMESNTLENSWMILFLSCRFPFRLDLCIGMGFRSSFDCARSLFIVRASNSTAKMRVTNPKSCDDCSPSNICPLEFTTWNVVQIYLSQNLTPWRHVPFWSIVAPPKAINRIGVFLSCMPVIFLNTAANEQPSTYVYFCIYKYLSLFVADF